MLLRSQDKGTCCGVHLVLARLSRCSKGVSSSAYAICISTPLVHTSPERAIRGVTEGPRGRAGQPRAHDEHRYRVRLRVPGQQRAPGGVLPALLHIRCRAPTSCPLCMHCRSEQLNGEYAGTSWRLLCPVCWRWMGPAFPVCHRDCLSRRGFCPDQACTVWINTLTSKCYTPAVHSGPC